MLRVPSLQPLVDFGDSAGFAIHVVSKCLGHLTDSALCIPTDVGGRLILPFKLDERPSFYVY